jgi:hypothetical protein
MQGIRAADKQERVTHGDSHTVTEGEGLRQI